MFLSLNEIEIEVRTSELFICCLTIFIQFIQLIDLLQLIQKLIITFGAKKLISPSNDQNLNKIDFIDKKGASKNLSAF